MKGTNYAARHDAGAFSAPVCLVRRTGKTKYEKGESRTGARLQEDAGAFFHPVLRDKPDIRLKKGWLFSIRRSRCFNPSSSLSARFCPSGAVLTCWKVTAGTTPARMLMCGKVANNNFDGQFHYSVQKKCRH